MNDFTREELENIAQQDNLMQSVFDKTQSMIDTYCDHESSDPLMGLVKECIKCKLSLDHRRWELSEDWDRYD